MAPSAESHHHDGDQRSGGERHRRKERHVKSKHRSPSRDSVPRRPRQTPGVFQYEPLDPLVDSIRLLELEPADKQQPLSCRLTHVPFLKRPVYEALSYTWGSPELINNILLNGKPMAIRQNLHDAFLALRKEHEPRVLWADAICIDQSNLEERERQVRFMDSIYERAATVLIWLGGADGMIQTAFKSGLAGLKENDRRAYCSWVCGHSYWTRLWIIQEVTLSRELRVCIGRSSEKWETFLENLSQHVKRYEDMRGQIGLIKNLDQKRKGRYGEKSCLEKLLEDFRYAKCQEPRDKIYGLLGLANDCVDGSIKADYTKPTFDLYTEVLKKFGPQTISKGSSTAFDRSMRVVNFSQLVSSVLGPMVLPPADTGTRIIAIAAVAGEILDVGPTHDDIFKDVRKLKWWKATHEGQYRHATSHSKIRQAWAAYEYYLYENSSSLSTKLCSISPDTMYSRGKQRRLPSGPSPRKSPTGNVAQKDDSDTKPVPEDTWDNNEANWLSQNVDQYSSSRSRADWRPPSHNVPRENNTRSRRGFFGTLFTSSLPSAPQSTAQPRVRPAKTPSSPCLFLGSNFLLGSVPANAKKGDIICQFWQTEVTALLRRVGNPPSFQIVGRVHLSTGYMNGLQPILRDRLEPKDGTKIMRIEMDLRTLSRLTC
ncbi:uncharacterized protein PAC_10594 [Phialocephala subalpina]|uniref:Heterokaryon incompatibility domain-containing protein n=1 Tax=Phialocephala subalpina TaxID=576137 RepID=A0A1L7X6R1_9HELO|nr:uncharacterized protein PAC_10594 [Phialocephala subalpina]